MPGPNQVLLVGDSLTGNTIRQIALEEAGYKVVPALGATAALAMASEHSFDVAVVDGYFAPNAVKDVLLGLRTLGVPAVLIAPSGISEELKRLADVHIQLTDVSWLVRLLPFVLQEVQANRQDTVVPLGVGGEDLHFGDHVAWLCANQQQVEDWVRFLEVGFERGDRGIVAGDSQAYERVRRILAAHGLDVAALLSADRLQHMNIGKMLSLGDAWVDEARQMISSAGCIVRILGSGSLRVPWPSEDFFYRYEQQVDSVIGGTRCVVACLYELNEVSGKLLWYGGVANHGIVVTPTGLRRNQKFVQPVSV